MSKPTHASRSERSHSRLLIEGAPPRFPSVYRRFLRQSDQVDVALTRLRISTLRLRDIDLTRVGRMRIVLAELTTSAWEVETHRALLDPRREAALRTLIARLQSGALGIRAAPLRAWSPDFSIFHRDEAHPRALLGPHWLESTPGFRGPRFAFSVSGSDATKVAQRFERLWESAYDVGPAVARLLGGTLEALDRLTRSENRSIVAAPQNWGRYMPP
jgi:hypothetical protein